MHLQRYIALLRGINVGGKNIIKMPELKAFFEDLGFQNVTTYIQSGNVLFTSSEKHNDFQKLELVLEKALSERFAYTSSVVIISYSQLSRVVKDAPLGFGSDPNHYRYDVMFLKSAVDADEALLQLSLREGVDAAYAGPGVIYFSRLISKAGQSYLNKVIALPLYKQMTIRNWNTTTKLLMLQ